MDYKYKNILIVSASTTCVNNFGVIGHDKCVRVKCAYHTPNIAKRLI